MKVVLHIGTSKTGTSSLQRSLRLAAAEPATWPIAYPTYPADRASHHHLAALYLTDAYLPRVLSEGGRRSPVELRAEGERAWEAIATAARSAEVLVISSELLYAIDEASIHDLASRLAGIGAEVEVVCYVRPPAAHYVAALGQRVRASRELLRPADHRLKLDVRLGRFHDAFAGRVTVRPYDRARLVGGDVIEDFRATFLPEVPALPRPALGSDNASLSAEGICLAHELRLHAWPDDDGEHEVASRVALELLAKIDEAPGASAASLVSGLADAITWSHDHDLAVLEARYGCTLAERVAPPGVPCPAWTATDPAEILAIDHERLDRLRWRLVRATAEQLVNARGRVRKLQARVDGSRADDGSSPPTVAS